MYKEFLDSGREGFQHVSYWTLDYPELYDKAGDDGYVVGHEGSIGGEQGRFAYLEKEGTSAGRTVIEISDIRGPKGIFFEHVRDLAGSWDGNDPIRKLN